MSGVSVNWADFGARRWVDLGDIIALVLDAMTEATDDVRREVLADVLATLRSIKAQQASEATRTGEVRL